MSTMPAPDHVTGMRIQFITMEGRLRCSLRRFQYLLPSDLIRSLRLDMLLWQPGQNSPNFFALDSELTKLSKRVHDFRDAAMALRGDHQQQDFLNSKLQMYSQYNMASQIILCSMYEITYNVSESPLMALIPPLQPTLVHLPIVSINDYTLLEDNLVPNEEDLGDVSGSGALPSNGEIPGTGEMPLEGDVTGGGDGLGFKPLTDVINCSDLGLGTVYDPKIYVTPKLIPCHGYVLENLSSTSSGFEEKDDVWTPYVHEVEILSVNEPTPSRDSTEDSIPKSISTFSQSYRAEFSHEVYFPVDHLSSKEVVKYQCNQVQLKPYDPGGGVFDPSVTQLNSNSLPRSKEQTIVLLLRLHIYKETVFDPGGFYEWNTRFGWVIDPG